jgi:hypothetical protein
MKLVGDFDPLHQPLANLVTLSGHLSVNPAKLKLTTTH